MSPPVFLAGTDALRRDSVLLDGPEGRHAATVRRLRPGERVDLTDGEGLLAECVVTDADRASSRWTCWHGTGSPRPRRASWSCRPCRRATGASWRSRP